MIEELLELIICFRETALNKAVLNMRYMRREIRELNYTKKNKIPRLSGKEKKEINDYWKKYGIRFRDFSWFARYYYVTGKKDPRFLPHPLLELVIYPFYNDFRMADAWSDKNAFSRHLPQMTFPTMIAQCINYKMYDADHNYFGTKVNEDFLAAVYKRIEARGVDTIIIKQTLNTNSGHGVRKYSIECLEDLRAALLENDRPNYIVQEPIIQHSFFAQFNDTSVNVIRLNTWRNGDEIVIFSPCIRFGMKGSITDVSYIDGKQIILAAGVNEDGIVSDYYWSNMNDRRQLNIENKKVPLWKEMCQLVKSCHSFLEYFDVVAWDMTVDHDNRIICVEYNLHEPGSIIYQYVHGPFLGDNTDKFLSFLKETDNQKPLIPGCIRR